MNMSLRNLQVDANVTEAELLKRSNGFLKKLVASFRQAAANRNFTFGPIKVQDADLNRVHGIVTEIDARRLFYACGEDEMPRYAMQSLYEARKVSRDASKGVWAGPSCEILVQDISAALSKARCARLRYLLHGVGMARHVGRQREGGAGVSGKGLRGILQEAVPDDSQSIRRK